MNAINKLFSEFPNHDRKSIIKSLNRYAYVLVEPGTTSGDDCSVIFVNDKSHLEYNEQYKHHCFTEMVRDYKLFVTYPSEMPTEATWYECSNIQKPVHTPVLFSDLDKLIAVSVEREVDKVMGPLMEDLPFTEGDVDYTKSAEFLYAEQNTNKFRHEVLLDYQVQWDGSHSQQLSRILFNGKKAAYLTISGKHGDCYDVRVVNLAVYKELLEFIEEGIVTYNEVEDIETYKADSEVDFLSRELAILLESGKQEHSNV